MVIPLALSSGALSIWSYAVKLAPPSSANTFVIAAVNVVFPWSTCPIVPILQCGFVRSNLSFAIILDSLNVYVVTTIIMMEKRKEIGAGEGNRTPVISLEGFCSTIELHPLIQTIIQVYAL